MATEGHETRATIKRKLALFGWKLFKMTGLFDSSIVGISNFVSPHPPITSSIEYLLVRHRVVRRVGRFFFPSQFFILEGFTAVYEARGLRK